LDIYNIAYGLAMAVLLKLERINNGSMICLVPKLWLGNAYPQALLDVSIKMNLFCLLTHQAELGNRHSQTGVWEREQVTHYE
jgi:hypothetical protein